MKCEARRRGLAGLLARHRHEATYQLGEASWRHRR